VSIRVSSPGSQWVPVPGGRPQDNVGDVITTTADEVTIIEPTHPDTVHSPTSAIRFGLSVVLVALVFVPLLGSGGDSSDFQDRALGVLEGLPRWLLELAARSLQILTVAAVVAGILTLLVLRRFARLLRVLVAAGLALVGTVGVSFLVGSDILHLGRPIPAIFGSGAAFPTTDGLAILCAGLVVQSPWWSARWRRVGRVVLVAGVLARVLTALPEPSTILMGLAVGVASAQLTHLVLGIPNQRPRAAQVAAVLNRFGYNIVSIEVTMEASFRGIATFRARCRDKGLLFVKVMNRESWAAGLPSRLYRYLRFREVGDERPFVAVRHRIEHEALCALKAFSDGVPTPRLTVVSEFPDDAMLLAFEAKHMRPLDALPESERDLDLLDKAWQVVVALRTSNTVHRRLNGEFLWIDDDRNVMVVDFSSAELGADERTLAADTAEVLAITAARLGVEAAVAAGVRAVGAEVVAHALPRLQPLALSRSTRQAVKEANCLEPLLAEVHRVTGSSAVPAADLERIKPRTLVSVVMMALGLTAIVPQLLGAGDVWSETRSANLWWVAAALGLSVVTYIGAAFALEGSVPDRLPFGPNLGVQFATSYIGVAAPGGAMALSARFLQRRGIDPALALAAVGVDTVAGVLVHFSLLGVFLAQAGTSGLKSFSFPLGGTVAVVGGFIVLIAIIMAGVPRTRSILAARLLPALKRAGHGIAETARHPMNLVELFGGSAAITMGYLLALEVSVLAFGRAPTFTSVALVYLVGSVISSVAPTPGGIGAVEATLIAGLTSAGMRSDSAIGAVMLFRIATFWLPLIPGWFAFTILQRSGDL
jgi:glycosyltransferase 2 family protein